MDKSLRFDVGGVVETTPKELIASRPENVDISYKHLNRHPLLCWRKRIA